jgi:hypothetical protein
MTSTVRILIVTVAIIPMMAATARAEPITIAFAGTVDPFPFFSPDDPFGGAIVDGTPFSGSYTYESNTVDGDPALNGGSYTSPGGSLSVLIRGVEFVAADLLNIGIGNGFGSGSDDYYTVFAQNTSGPNTFDITLTLQDVDGTAFTSALLPGAAPLLTLFEVRSFFLSGFYAGNQVQIGGSLTSLATVSQAPDPPGEDPPTPVPEPTSLALLVVGAAALVAGRGRPGTFLAPRRR